MVEGGVTAIATIHAVAAITDQQRLLATLPTFPVWAATSD